MKGNILLIDSGVGGISTLKSIKRLLPYEDYVYYADNKNMPYGDKAPEFLIENTKSVLRHISDDYALKMAVLACNTLTGVAVEELRACFPELPIVGMEPALRPAGHSGGKTAVLCTRNTGKSLFDNKKLFGADAEIITLPSLARLIEEDASDAELTSYLKEFLNGVDFDNIVLGCTHYCLKRELFERIYPRAKFFDGNDGVARRVKNLLEQSGSVNDRHFVPSTVLVLSRPERSEIGRYIRLLRQK